MADPVWLLLMFDLPVVTKPQRSAAASYRKDLLELGFTQIQLSVYARYLINSSGARPVITFLRYRIPPDGAVRILRLTDEQWAAMDRYYGRRPMKPEARPGQLALFRPESDTESEPETPPTR